MERPTRVLLALLPLLLVLAGACAAEVPAEAGLDPEADPESPLAGKADGVCPVAGPTEEQGFDRFLSNFFFGEARHAVEEPVVQPGDAFSLRARFRYGLVSKDLEEEPVEAFVRLEECGEWIFIGDAVTDDDGMVDIPFDASLLPGPGSYEVELVVLGDISRARGQIEVVSPGQPMVVFDIDGTLTLSDSELTDELLGGREAAMYEASPEVAWRYADEGYLVVYLSGRPHMLQDMSRRWLERHGFPAGPIITTDHLFEVTGPLVEVHKVEKLEDLIDRAGVSLYYAYGNATTDVCSYAEAGLDPAYTYIVGENGGSACDGYAATVALDGYEEHLESLDALPAAWE